MQCTVMYFNVPTATNIAGIGAQKVAVKLSSKTAAALKNDSGQFAEIIAALMSLPASGINPTQNKLQWVSAEDGSKESVPLLDLSGVSNPESVGPKMVQLLMNSTGQGAAPGRSFQQYRSGLADVGSDKTASALTVAPDTANSAEVDLDQLILGKKVDWPASNKSRVATQAQPEMQMSETPNAAQPLSADAASPLLLKKTGHIKQDLLSNMNAGEERADLTSLPTIDDGEGNLSSNKPIAISTQLPPATEEKKAFGPLNQKILPDSKKVVQSQAVGNTLTTQEGQETNLSDTITNSEHRFNDGLRRHASALKKEVDGFSRPSQASASGNGSGTMPAGSVPDDMSPSFEAHLKNSEHLKSSNLKGATDPQANTKDLQSDVVHQIVQRMTVRSDGQLSQMNIKLKPEFLGNMHLEITTENQQVAIRMTADNHHVKNMIEQNIQVLKAEMQQQGLQVHKIDVFVSQDQDAWKNGQQQTAFRQSQDHPRQQAGQREGRQKETMNPSLSAVSEVNANAALRANNSEVDFFA